MAGPILSDDELNVQFEQALAKRKGLDATEKARERARHDQGMEQRQKAREALQASYDAHKGRR